MQVLRLSFYVSMALFIVLGGSCQAGASEATYKLQPENTRVQWTGNKPTGKHEGGFKKVSGMARISETEGLVLEIDFDCTSIYSDNFILTQHLKSGDFFSVRQHPTASFRSTRVEKSNGAFVVVGNLTLLGKTKEISFPAKINAGETLELKAKFAFNRTDFGMVYGKGKVDDMVEVQVEVQASSN